MKSLKTFLIFGALAGSVFASAQQQIYVPGEVIVKFKPSTTLRMKSMAHWAIGARVEKKINALRVEKVKLRSGMSVEDAIAYYKRQRGIDYAQPNYIVKKFATSNDPMLPDQYSFAKMQVFDAWDLNLGKSSVTIAVIDDGIQMDHPDFVGKIVRPFDQADGDNFPQGPASDTHGTHVAGIAAAATNNGVGVAGVGRNCTVMPIRFDFTNFGSAESIIHAANNGAKVINMSYGTFIPGIPQPIIERDAVDYAWSKGVVPVAAAGNDNTLNFISWPAYHENVIAVASTDQNDARSTFSNYGPDIDVAAPGTDILSTVMGSGYEFFNGTSMASPNTAGVVGLIWSHAPSGTTVEKVREVLESTSDNVGNFIAHGRVNAFKALSSFAQRVTVFDSPVFLGVHEGRAITSTGRVVDQDGLYLDLIAKNVPRLGQVASIAFRFHLPVEPFQIETVTIGTLGRQSATSTGQIYAWNWNAGRWDNLRSYPMGNADIVGVAILKNNITTYASDTGEVRILLRSLVPAGFNNQGGSTYRIDHLYMKTVYLEATGP